MKSLFLKILFLSFLISGCMGGSGAGGALSGPDGGSGVGGGVGQGQPTNEGVSDVEPGTPVECEKNPTHADCKKELGLTAPGGEPEPPPPGPDDFTL